MLFVTVSVREFGTVQVMVLTLLEIFSGTTTMTK